MPAVAQEDTQQEEEQSSRDADGGAAKNCKCKTSY